MKIKKIIEENTFKNNCHLNEDINLWILIIFI